MEARTRKFGKWIHEGGYAAEIQIEFHYSEESWSPTMSPADAHKLDTVRLALKRGDIAEAAKHGLVYKLRSVATE